MSYMINTKPIATNADVGECPSINLKPGEYLLSYERNGTVSEELTRIISGIRSLNGGYISLMHMNERGYITSITARDLATIENHLENMGNDPTKPEIPPSLPTLNWW